MKELLLLIIFYLLGFFCNTIPRFLVTFIAYYPINLVMVDINNYYILLIVLFPLLIILIIIMLKLLYSKLRVMTNVILLQIMQLELIPNLNCFTKKQN